jgi:2-oxoglutarate ferredoxin oxidoreductase subunit beta
MHDGSLIKLKKLEADYDPTDRWHALRVLEDADLNNYMVTGLIYADMDAPSMFDLYDLPAQALNRMTERQLRPPRESIDKINAMF